MCQIPGGRGGKFKLPTLTELHQHLFLHEEFRNLESMLKDNKSDTDTAFDASKIELEKITAQISEALSQKEENEVAETVEVSPEKIKTIIIPKLKELQNLIAINDLSAEDLYMELKPELDSLLPLESNQLQQAIESFDAKGAAKMLNQLFLKIERQG